MELAIPDDLIEAIGSRRCVLVLGRKVNKNAEISYRDLLAKLVRACADAKSISISQKNDLLTSLRLGELQIVADTLSSASQSVDLKALLSPTLISEEAKDSYKALQSIQFQEILSEAHDRSLDDSMPHLNKFSIFTSEDAKGLLDSKSQNLGFILKLFGGIGADNAIVSNLEFADAVSKNLILKQFLDGILASRILLFVGCDLDFVSQFMMSIGGAANSAQSHYLLTNNLDRLARSRLTLLEHRFTMQTLRVETEDVVSDESLICRFFRNINRRVSAYRKVASHPNLKNPPSPGIRRLLLEDIGPFERLDLGFSSRHKWKIVLGDNGVGKSTILKAIAIAIVGGDAKRFAGRLVRAGKTMGRITLYTDLAPNGYVTEIYAKDMANEAEIVSKPTRCLDAEGWLSLGFSPLRLINWNTAGGPKEVVSNARPTSDDLVPLLSGEVDTRANQIKQWIINLDASSKSIPASLNTEHDAAVRLVEFFPRGDRLLSAGEDGVARIWSAGSQKMRQLRSFKVGSLGTTTLFAVDTTLQHLVCGSSSPTIAVWNLNTYKKISQLTLNGKDRISCLAMLGRAIFAGTRDGQLLIADDFSDKEVPQYRVGKRGAGICALSVAPKSKLIFAGFSDGSIRIFNYDMRDFSATVARLRSSVASFRIDSAEKKLIVGLSDGSVFIVDLVSEKVDQIVDSDTPISSVALSSDEKLVGIGDVAGRTRVWNVTEKKFEEILDTHVSSVECLAFHPKGDALISGGRSGNIKAWSLSSGSDRESKKLVITQFFGLIADLTDRRDIEFLRVSESFRVMVRTADVPKGLPIESLSQGMISLLSWFGVLYQRLSDLNPGVPASSLMSQPALVLIDELDAHMHPLWQQGLVAVLKRIAPNVQFIACTHSPLIVAGLEKDEVERLQIVDGSLVSVDFDADMTLGRPDQILAGELFSLPTTLDVGTQQLLDRYVELLGISEKNYDEEQEFLSLTERIEERVPPSPSAILPRRVRELLSLLYKIDFRELENGLAKKVQASISLLSKALKQDISVPSDPRNEEAL